MTADHIALQLGARRTGPGKWQARCPAHDDATPSLSIKEGEAGRVLLHCWAGCDLAAVLKAAGLTVSSLFTAGPAPTRAQLDAVAAKREARRVIAAQERLATKEVRERVQKLAAVVAALGGKLAAQPESDALAALFHLACERLHSAEHAMESFTPASDARMGRIA